tara:strand:+ start:3325 stop:4173 length:849 start_codon:yes stop_codon:yes gene_type:complete
VSNKKEIKKGLYIVSTPIGNLRDITLRAIDILKKSDFILCEDTRVSKVLLDNYEVNSKLISNYKFNEKKNISKIIPLLRKGAIISLISDAGTPAISDPGSILINECIKNNIDIIPLPGASSVSSAISISGFSEKFFFYGFLPEKKKILENDFKNLAELNSSIVFFISSKKFNRVVPFIKKSFSGRKIVICREMTKFYEEYIRTDVEKLENFDLNLRGELTIVISDKINLKKNSKTLNESDKMIIKKMINKLSVKEITSLLNQNKKISKKEIYNYCLSLKNEN